MTRGRLFLVVIFFTYLLCAEGAFSSLYNTIYKNVDAEPCVMVLGNDGIVGCKGPEHGAVAPLYPVRSAGALANFASSPPKESKAIVLDPTIFNKATLDTLYKTGKVTGILLLNTMDAPIGGSSSDTTFPNKAWGLHSDSTYEWNPLGDSLNYATIPFPIFVVEQDYIDDIIEHAEENVVNGEGVYPRWAVQFNSFMHGTKDAATCLNRGQCLPLGTKSVWSSFTPVGSKPIVLAMASLDSNALFHNKATGAESTISGVAALIAAAQALSYVNKTGFTSDIVFSFWAGESWGYMGSRKFVKDIQGFKCESVNEKDNSCTMPYKSSLAFQNFKLDQVSAVVELNQIGLTSSSLYIHEETNANADNLIQTLVGVSDAANLDTKFTAVDNTALGLPGIPPSSLMTFLQANPNLPGVVITDYEKTYRNQYYNTHFDDGTHQTANETQICEAATLMARSLYVLASGASPTDADVAAIVADCGTVNQLLYCLTTGFASCELSQQILSGFDLPDQASYYPSVFAYSVSQQLVILPVKFIFDFLANATATSKGATCTSIYDCDTNAGETCSVGYCTKSNTFYHDAVSPGIDWDYKNSKWIVVDKTQPVWTESNWDSTSVQLFQQDNPASEGWFLAFGLILFIGSGVIVFFVQRYFLNNYKLL